MIYIYRKGDNGGRLDPKSDSPPIIFSADPRYGIKLRTIKARHGSLKNFLLKCIFYRYYHIKRLVDTSLEDIPHFFIFFMVAILKSKMVSTNREYSTFYNSFFLLMDGPSINFVSCTMTSIECNNSDIILRKLFSKLL